MESTPLLSSSGALPTGTLSLLNGAASAPRLSPSRAVETAREFESMFLRLLVEEMLPKEESGLYGSGAGAGIVRGLMAGGVGDALSKGGQLGIAPLIEKEVSELEDPRSDGLGAPNFERRA